mmetsp:Transcript_6835/g.18924  ORF Transcript_6835/g.18924 Transcript_6835/m.18924 type:complete len:290 (-) Transcript_6835:692-1561(-)
MVDLLLGSFVDFPLDVLLQNAVPISLHIMRFRSQILKVTLWDVVTTFRQSVADAVSRGFDVLDLRVEGAAALDCPVVFQTDRHFIEQPSKRIKRRPLAEKESGKCIREALNITRYRDSCGICKVESCIHPLRFGIAEELAETLDLVLDVRRGFHEELPTPSGECISVLLVLAQLEWRVVFDGPVCLPLRLRWQELEHDTCGHCLDTPSGHVGQFLQPGHSHSAEQLANVINPSVDRLFEKRVKNEENGTGQVIQVLLKTITLPRSISRMAKALQHLFVQLVAHLVGDKT